MESANGVAGVVEKPELTFERYTVANEEPPAFHVMRNVETWNGRAVRKIAIVGRAPSTMTQAPYQDDSWEIWTLGNAAVDSDKPSGVQKGPLTVPRWSRLFELHNLDEKFRLWPKSYQDWLAIDHGKPVVIGRPHQHIPHGVVYPWQPVFERFGTYLNNSISLMIAMALLEGATDLALFGIDMAQNDPAMHNGNPEYQHQRPSCENMIGRAQELCRAVYIPTASDLLKTTQIYAYEDDRYSGLREKLTVRARELRQKYEEAMNNFRVHRDQSREWEKIAAKFAGAIEDNDYSLQRIQ